MNLDEPAFMQHPALLGTRPETQEYKHFDSTHKDAGEDEGGATSTLDAKLDTSTGKEMDASGHPGHKPSAERR